MIAEFARRTGRGVLGNQPASGTAVLDQYGEEHQRTGKWIVYTSADSVFQVAAHEGTVPLAELYAACESARGDAPGRARRLPGDRPAVRGRAGRLGRAPPRRKDFSLPPPGPTLLDRLAERHVPRVGVGKVDDLFAGRGITSIHTATNAEAYALIEGALRRDAARAAAGQRDRVRPDLGPPERRRPDSSAGCRSWTARCPGCWRRCGRTTSLSLPPITATTRPRRPPIIRARSFRCWSSGPRVRPVSLGRRHDDGRHRPDGGRVSRGRPAGDGHLFPVRGLD